MYDFKIFPSAKSLVTADERDKKFLEQLVAASRDSKARFVNFSLHNYGSGTPAPRHFITYPMDWIIHYLQSQFIEHDPLFRTDYRRASCLDWRDLYSDDNTELLFREFRERQLGNQGITLSCRIRDDCYGVASFVFQVEDEQWAAYRSANIEMLRLLTVSLSEQHESVYYNQQVGDYKITKRERACLYWVAMGKTDKKVGEILSIGRWTVIGHLKSAKFKLGCSNRASAVAKAISLGIIDINRPEI